MLASVKGYYEKGKITLREKAPVESKTEVVVTFLTDSPLEVFKRIPGALKGKYLSLMILMSHWRI
ncbi:hypothetical protein EZJ43_07340 [Pedobacter changchengzhani]|uniref:Uncharacterized protein n=1 Tax=Pedobacter changchengzhani TaxID=2529274 RepID=A0A4R5MKY9_9SPHI|nr:hypothetical protein [Pedobacter changchengzhani]TDG36331.1 hypothetical protein EZJ43_07340 [Pedobacter changchengzhani]